MKIFISLIVSVLCFAKMSAQEHYYYYKGEKVYLELNTDYVFISSTGKNNIKNARINVSVDNNNSTKIIEDRASRIFSKPIGFVEKHSLRYYRELNLTDNFSQTKYLTEIQQLRQENSNLIVSPCFQNQSIDKIGLSNYFYVKLKHQDDFSILLEQIAKHHVELVGYNKFMPLWFTLSVTPTTPNAMQMANLFYETGLFEHTEPDLMVKVLLSNESPSNSPPTPNDPYYEHQWHLNNTGQYGGIPGMDINVEDAWDVTLGDGVKVAIIDEGFEMTHPDLSDNIVGDGYDTETRLVGSIVYGPHGTACAGIIGAKQNNDEGVSGVAPNTGLISISNTIDTDSLAPIVQQELADGINWAWQNGADIISNSWVRDDLASALMDDAITEALTKGRGGLGTIVVFAAGNGDSNYIEYPANSNPDILVVGAMSPCGERKSFNSCDDEQLWGSSYGDQLDVVAPGVLITTTDRQGSNGYNAQNSNIDLDYTDVFRGTSSACPMVAGVAALVLSVNPSLTVQEVNDIIEQSARKVNHEDNNGIYEYAYDFPNGEWDTEMGYGLVDAHAAVTLAQSYCTTDLTFNGSINSGTYEVSNTINATGNIGNIQSVTFNAGRSICLNDDFIADASNGSTFLAQIEGCSVSEGLVSTDNSIVYVMKDIEEHPAIDEVAISKNIPNPFTGKTTIEFTLKEDSPVTLSVFDVNGKQIAVLLNNKQQSVGAHQVTFDGNDYPAGMYYYTVQAGEYIETQKMTLVKP